jgi:hypothetical protein
MHPLQVASAYYHEMHFLGDENCGRPGWPIKYEGPHFVRLLAALFHSVSGLPTLAVPLTRTRAAESRLIPVL